MKQTGNIKHSMEKGRATANTSQPVNSPGAGVATTASSGSWWTRMPLVGRFLLPLRLFLGVTFVYAGIQKLADPQYFKPSAPGFIGKQIMAFATGSPVHGFLLHFALPHAVFFGALVAFGEIAIGIGTLLGLLLRPAAFFGMLLNLLFFLSASWRVYPYFYGADIVFVFAWITLLLAGPLTSGLPSIDALLVPRFLSWISPESRMTLGPVLNFLLGVGEKSVMINQQQVLDMLAPNNTARPAGQAQGSAYNSKVSGYPQGVPYNIINNQGRPAYTQGMPQPQRQSSYRAKQAAMQRSQASRRGFLWGLLAGGLGVLGITFVGRVVHFGGDDNATSTLPGTGSGGDSGSGSASNSSSGTATSSGSSGGTGGVIAQVSAVPDNSAVTFTIPSNGDPGVLVRLNNGKFVAFDAACTHAGCPVQFDPSSSHLLCPCHGAEFDPANGAAVVQGPTDTPLTSVPINVDNKTGAITLQL